jgi:aspartate ammonia-lyase
MTTTPVTRQAGPADATPLPPTRVEHDLLGDRDVPADVYWGVHTLRAVENFPVTGTTVGRYPNVVRALACVKHAAAHANRDLGTLEPVKADAIIHVCQQLEAGRYTDQFVVDMIQGGAGTSTNMNANEVIANLALEYLGHPKGTYSQIHPNEDVNQSQSTNDVYPTALKLGTIFAAAELDAAMEHLKTAFDAKAVELARVVKVGRTQLQDAVPMTLGQEFASYAVMIGEDQERLREATTQLHEINLGATAIGTGITADPAYAALAREHLADITGLPLVTAPNLVEATQDCGVFVLFSGALRRIAVKLSKICNDLRLLSSGPRAGLGEINLPPRQAGSSIMPGKVNPVIPEMVNQIAFEVIGNDLTITMATEAGQLQLNAFEPIIGYSTVKSLAHLEVACRQLADLCIDGITANEEFLRRQVESSIGVVTVLNPHIGYTAATAIAQQALDTGRTIPDLAAEMAVLPAEQLHRLLQPESLANLPDHTDDGDNDDATVLPRE